MELLEFLEFLEQSCDLHFETCFIKMLVNIDIMYWSLGPSDFVELLYQSTDLEKKHDSKEQIYYFIKFINAKLSVFGHLVSQGFLKNYLSQIEAQTHFVFKSPSIKCLPLFQFWNNIHNIYFDKTTDRMWFSGTGLSLLTSDHAMLFRFLESFSDVFVPRASKSERTRRKELFIGFS